MSYDDKYSQKFFKDVGYWLGIVIDIMASIGVFQTCDDSKPGIPIYT